jgi:aromatic-L-amino-acid decarboxylase
MSPDDFRALGRQVVDWIADYWERVDEMPVLSQVKPGEIAAMLPERPPERGLERAPAAEAWAPVFNDLARVIMPGLTHWQSPNFYAYFPCNASFPAILGEFLSAGLNVNGMLWATSPAATELETRVLDWAATMIGLPDGFLSSGRGGGCIQGTASDSTLVAMVAARKRTGAGAHLVAYASTQAHSSVAKAAMIAGIASGPGDHQHVRLIHTDETYAMRPDLLEGAMREDVAAGRTPFFVCATVGTTSSTAIDPVDAVAAAIQRAAPGAWLHVDAAHAGCACVCPEFRGMLQGVHLADSLCFNPHKWLLTNFDCDCFFVRDRAALRAALSVTPEYLRNAASGDGQVIDYRDWQVPLGRRFRALKLWLVIRHYGLEGLRAHIREHLRLAALVESWVRTDARFELAAPRTLNLVCFRLRGEGPGADQANRALLDRINGSGRAHLSHTVLAGRFVLRMAIGATLTRERHVRGAWELIAGLAGDPLSSPQ